MRVIKSWAAICDQMIPNFPSSLDRSKGHVWSSFTGTNLSSGGFLPLTAHSQINGLGIPAKERRET